MSVIHVAGLRKVFQVHRKPEGGWARFAASLYRPEWRRQVDHDQDADGDPASNGRGGLGARLHALAGPAAVAFRIGSVFGQKSQLWLHLPPVDTFNLLARIYELDWQAYMQRRAELVELFELGEIMHTPARKLSLGQRMRCEIAASLLHRLVPTLRVSHGATHARSPAPGPVPTLHVSHGAAHTRPPPASASPDIPLFGGGKLRGAFPACPTGPEPALLLLDPKRPFFTPGPAG